MGHIRQLNRAPCWLCPLYRPKLASLSHERRWQRSRFSQAHPLWRKVLRHWLPLCLIQLRRGASMCSSSLRLSSSSLHLAEEVPSPISGCSFRHPCPRSCSASTQLIPITTPMNTHSVLRTSPDSRRCGALSLDTPSAPHQQ